MTITIAPELKLNPVHPFPARMAPEIASAAIRDLESKSTVLDPMCGSGLALREAVQQGHRAIGFDIDPLAVLMSNVWTRPLDDLDLVEEGRRVIEAAKCLEKTDVCLPWIDDDLETTNFVDFWFAHPQRDQLRNLAYLVTCERGSIYDALMVALSRIIVTKKVGASLAWDVSHSRPHRVKKDNDFDVYAGFSRAVSSIANEIRRIPRTSDARVGIGNAKTLNDTPNDYVDLVLTSPPYFNAIDYIRGHRLALVWLGYRMSDLRSVRSSSVGRDKSLSQTEFDEIGLSKISLPQGVDSVTRARVRQYVFDMAEIMIEIRRVVKPDARVVMVVAGSTSKGHLIDSPGFIGVIGESIGFRIADCIEREIPNNRRYLPPPNATDQESLMKRMRTESVLTFEKSGVL